jgi:hypothetical protein
MNKRVPERIHTRKIDRKVAKNKMKAAGYTRICSRKKNRNGKKGDSVFSTKWRKYAA